jgi:hypothetical protein
VTHNHLRRQFRRGVEEGGGQVAHLPQGNHQPGRLTGALGAEAAQLERGSVWRVREPFDDEIPRPARLAIEAVDRCWPGIRCRAAVRGQRLVLWA